MKHAEEDGTCASCIYGAVGVEIGQRRRSLLGCDGDRRVGIRGDCDGEFGARVSRGWGDAAIELWMTLGEMEPFLLLSEDSTQTTQTSGTLLKEILSKANTHRRAEFLERLEQAFEQTIAQEHLLLDAHIRLDAGEDSGHNSYEILLPIPP